MKQDIRPVDLAQWLNKVASTNRSDFFERSVLQNEYELFCRANQKLSLPKLLISDAKPAIFWGSDIQVWGIILDNHGAAVDSWTNGLRFWSIEK